MSTGRGVPEGYKKFIAGTITDKDNPLKSGSKAKATPKASATTSASGVGSGSKASARMSTGGTGKKGPKTPSPEQPMKVIQQSLATSASVGIEKGPKTPSLQQPRGEISQPQVTPATVETPTGTQTLESYSGTPIVVLNRDRETGSKTAIEKQGRRQPYPRLRRL